MNGMKISSTDCSLEINSKNIPDRMKIVFDTNVNKTLFYRGSFYIDNLYYKNAGINLTGQHYTKITFKQQESQEPEQKPLIKDAIFSVESRQAGSQAVKNAPSDAKKQGSITSTAAAGVTAAGINLSGDLSVSYSSNDTDTNIFRNAGHSIKTEEDIAGLFAFEETYRFNHDDKNLRKTNSLYADFSELGVPVKLGAKTEAKNAWSTQSQTSGLEIKTTPGIFEFSQKADFSQKINTKKTSSKTFNTNNYFQGWNDITLFAFSDGDRSAIYRSEKYTTGTSVKLPVAGLKPSLSYELNSTVTNSYEYLFADSEGFTLAVPFKFGANNFKFTASKSAGGTEDKLFSSNLENNYFEDTKELLKNQGNRTYMYKTVPFYDFFQSDLKDWIQDEKKTDVQRLTYSTKYETTWNRRLFNTPKDLIIPSFVSFGVTRDLVFATKQSDIRQYRVTLTNNSINNFGRDSFTPVFKWYEQDEFITSLTGILKVPDDLPQNATWSLSGYIQILLFINDTDTLKTALDGTLETNADYSGKTTLIWQRKGYTTPAVELAKFISKKAAETDFSISRKETLNLEFSKSGEIKKQVYSFAHSVEAKFLKHYTISTGLGIDFKYFSNSANILALNFTIGGKAEF
jgi:DNA polymerase-4